MRHPVEFNNHNLSFSDAANEGGYRAVCKDIVDGDTIYALIDLGFYRYPYINLRIGDIDTWELRGPNKDKGKAAKQFVIDLILNKPIFIKTRFDTTLGRVVAVVYYFHDGMMQPLSRILRKNGFEKIRD